MNHLHPELLVLDVGSAYIKCLYARINWYNQLEYITAYMRPSAGIDNGHITDLESLYNAVLELIYEVEVGVGINFKAVIIICDFFELQSSYFYNQIPINGEILSTHTNSLQNLLQATLNNKRIISYVENYYTLDNIRPIVNPVSMKTHLLGLYTQYVTMDDTDYSNLEILCEKIGTNLYSVMSGVVINGLALETNNILIDVGLYHTRVYINTAKPTLFNINLGMQKLLNNINSDSVFSTNNQFITTLFNNNIRTHNIQLFVKNLIQTILHKVMKTVDISHMDIYLSGGITLIPMIHKYLQLTFSKTFHLLHSHIDFNCIAGPKFKTLFAKCVGMAQYIAKDYKLPSVFEERSAIA